MKGFDSNYKNLTDYILKITKQIWEGKDVESISKYYSENIPVRSPFGITYGFKPVIDATYKTLDEFPDRQLLGEDVIWSGNDDEGYHSSHRILSKATHLNDGYYGKKTGNKIVYRVIADCACKNNQVYDEWIVRDQGAMVRQIGYSPKEFAKKIIESEGGISTASRLFDFETDKSSNYEAERYKKRSKAEKYSEILKNIFNYNYKFEEYDRAANIFWPGNKIGHGREVIKEKWNSLKVIFSNIKFTIEHVGFLEETGQNPRISVRWFLEGTHSNDSMDYDKASNKKIFIMWINHAEFYSNSIIREWVLFDEVAIWTQILLNHG